MLRTEGVVVDPNRTVPSSMAYFGVFAAARHGANVPPKYGNWNMIYRRFRRWSEAGIWEIVSVTLAEIMADSGHYSIDSTTVRAYVLAAGGKGGSSTRSWSLAGRVHQ